MDSINAFMRKILLVCLLVGFWPLMHAENIVLKGRVTDSSGQSPIPFVIVALQDSGAKQYTAVCDLAGNFTFSTLHKGKYTLMISQLGYKPVDIPLETDTTTNIGVQLAKMQFNLSQVTITSSARDIGQTLNTVNRVDMLLRPINSAQDLMRLVPGLFIAQHQGGGKAEQIFLRGFDADHGTDFGIFWDGIPVNMPSHAHGQGYADSHFIIPETIDQLNVYKGTYATQFGDFVTAGAASVSTKDFAENIVKTEYGAYGYDRVMGTLNLISNDKHLISKYKESAYISAENMYNAASYFAFPQDYKRFSIFGKYYGQLSEKTFLTVEGSYFQSTWNGSGQIPTRAVSNGIISRFGAIDPSEGGSTDRTNANLILKTTLGNGGILINQGYYSYYQLNLFTDFTFFLVDTVHGDGINQRDRGRNIFGYNGTYEKHNDIGERDLKTVIGLTTKVDEGELSLRHQEQRVILDTVSMGKLYEQNVAVYADETYHITNNLILNAGIRADYFYFQYKTEHSVLPSSLIEYPQFGDGTSVKTKISPKLNIYYNLNKNVQFFIRSGYGFHSNDARVIVGSSANANTLPTALGYELGSTFKPFDKILVNAVVWGMHLQNELTYDQDLASDVVNGPTQRFGADFSIRYQITQTLYFDVDANYSQGRYTDLPERENYIPLAPTFTSIAGITLKTIKGFNASFRYRYIDDRPADNTNTIVAKGYFLADAIIKYRVKQYEFGAQVENIFNINWNEAQFDTTTRLKGESLNGVNELCFTPGAPRIIKASISYYF
jgi:outer membrane receptor protein involved in Fe transport